ncbi:hypothetical protein EVAR_50900_1 [Eumeta japonica]|uniref:ATP-dependent DNA helicase n=1 Tax=Eumeta variegata TaxID=151549 RepID=A0A4C1Y9J2_EUMVA|nr:hypothetical protein EVAR_50900_1 [Eumeta japonica]
MAHKKSLEALNFTLKDLRRNNIFGGLMILLAGDFRQTLPVVLRGTPADELNACLKASPLWNNKEEIKDARKNQSFSTADGLSTCTGCENSIGSVERFLKGLRRQRTVPLTRIISYDLCNKIKRIRNKDNLLGQNSQICRKQLKNIGAPLEDAFLVVIMLSGLTTDYDPLFMTLENSNLNLIRKIVKGKLLQEHPRIDEKTKSALALVCKRLPKRFRCKKTGHFIKNYPFSGNKKETKVLLSSKALLTALSMNTCNVIYATYTVARLATCPRTEPLFLKNKEKLL